MPSSLYSRITLSGRKPGIDNISKTGTGGLVGISYGTPTKVTLDNNTINNLASNSTTNTGAISGIQGISAVDIITNNTITNITSTSTSSHVVCGILVIGGTGGTGNKTIQNNIVNNYKINTYFPQS